MGLNSSARTIAVSTLLNVQARVCVGAKPYLGRSIFWLHGHKGDIDNECKWVGWMIEISI